MRNKVFFVLMQTTNTLSAIHLLSLFFLELFQGLVDVHMSHLSLHSLLKVPTESYLSQLSWQDSPLYTETQQERRQSQSPLEPPSPAPGQQPVQVLELWEQYLDPSTGRSFYVNSITKERSWKPPRRARGRTTTKVTQTGFTKFQEFLQAFKNSHIYITSDDLDC